MVAASSRFEVELVFAGLVVVAAPGLAFHGLRRDRAAADRLSRLHRNLAASLIGR